jgi:LCP family protein required for cell wall assembly
MADRPGRDGSDDGPEFNWLYGGEGRPEPDNPDATRPIQQQPRPRPDDESTRVMSAQPREPSRPTPPPVAPQPVSPPPGTTYRGGGGSRFRRPKFWIRTVMVLVLLWIVYLVAVPLIAWNRVDKVAFEPGGDRPGEQDGTTYLLVGSDSRGDLTKEERKELGTGNASGQRTDTIMLLHTGSGPNLLMSIPRDSIVDVPGHGTTKINSAFAFGGPELLVQTIENETGIRVDQYVEIGFGGFVDLVDAVNGIEICPKEAMKDPLANLDIKKGCQDVDGVTALGYARSRHTSGIGDIDRARHQREVVAAIGRKVASPWSIVNPFRYWNLNMAATQAVAFGEGTSPWRAAMWASAMTNVDGTDGLTCGVPIADLAVNWDEERSQKLFQAIIDDDTDSVDKKLCTPTGIAK